MQYEGRILVAEDDLGVRGLIRTRFPMPRSSQLSVGAGGENRTRDIQLGKLTFYL